MLTQPLIEAPRKPLNRRYFKQGLQKIMIYHTSSSKTKSTTVPLLIKVNTTQVLEWIKFRGSLRKQSTCIQATFITFLIIQDTQQNAMEQFLEAI